MNTHRRGTVYQASTPLMGRRPLAVAEVSRARFSRTRWLRRGLVAGEVYPALERVARELGRLQRENYALAEENARLKDGLREWQGQQSASSAANNDVCDACRPLAPCPHRRHSETTASGSGEGLGAHDHSQTSPGMPAYTGYSVGGRDRRLPETGHFYDRDVL